MVGARGSLLRVLGVGFGIAVAVGGGVGVGILRTPGAIAEALPHPGLILLVWVLGGAYALLQANNLSELAAAHPRSGGPYVFARRAFGPYGGFVVGWADWLSLVVATAYLPLALGEFVARLVPAWLGFEPLIAFLALATLLGVQMRGVKAGSRVQEVVALLKALALLAFVALCFVAAPAAREVAAPAAALVPQRPVTVLAFAGALQLVIGAYGGWYAAAFFGEEQKDPGRAVPRALLSSVLVMLVLYVSVNLAYLRILPMGEFMASKLPAASAMQRVFGGASDQVVTGLSVLLMIGIVNALVMIAPRALYALACDGLFVRQAVSVNTGGTPVGATIVTVAVAVALAATGTFERLFALTAFLMIVVDASNNVGLLLLRVREPEMARPYRAIGAPATTIVSLCVALALLAGFTASDPRTAAIGVAFIACSYPLFRFASRGAAARTTPSTA
ncbi:MAG: APC family permease [Gemmatimonadetes bacterium]|nr:APC family permease [Gemmatimonadota bacterium]